ncbi:uncharacterized protein TRIADDRAFT_31783 [Trichoplax adhaerens]|uniref:G-protein coupled receptors family 1 profile domain-containing protein n=1 Tax=Trichoplax adhaerens TaxID=10228 RepID=B3S9K8_TRIAD|nr:hypothetical protein TRIADDRAFT_31783 [Trichoplax adhaerens]EDV20492.1 hypothetical protein TRIADDRAFT_31783 [Trichoplax adhaerens]|eukprot:XP_002116918.1 hypothetical protein TRIADDRAFT_31783 [Trichoplax adhaerens]
MSLVTDCQPLPDQFTLSTCTDILSHTLLRVFIWMIGVISAIGNFIAIIWHTKSMTKEFQVVKTLLINLSIADFTMGIYLINIASANIYFAGIYSEYLETWLRSPFCSIASSLITLSSFMSTVILFLISLDRYWGLVYMFDNYRLSYRFVVISLSLSWVLSIIYIGLPVIYSINQPSQYRFHGTNGACIPGNLSNTYFLIWLIFYCAFTFVIWITISMMYIAMIVTLTRIRKQANRQISSVEKIIQAKMIAIVITDLICWMPLYIVLLRFLFGYGLDTHSLPFIAVLSLPVNSCINPIFYTIFTRTFLNKANNMIRQLRNILTLCQVYLYQCHSNSSSQSFGRYKIFYNAIKFH